MFDHEGPVVASAMRGLTIGVFEHLEITYPIYVKKSILEHERSEELRARE